MSGAKTGGTRNLFVFSHPAAVPAESLLRKLSRYAAFLDAAALRLFAEASKKMRLSVLQRATGEESSLPKNSGAALRMHKRLSALVPRLFQIIGAEKKKCARVIVASFGASIQKQGMQR